MKNLLICLPFLLAVAAGAEENRAKLISAFQIVKFPNDPCKVSTSGGKNGTCYTKEECSNHGGLADGTCAEGYGVCCVFKIGCGSTIAENTTYFEVTSAVAGRCNAKICKANANICQIRLDFDTFAIAGPSTLSTSIGKNLANQFSVTGKKYSYATTCSTDTFEVTNAPNVPVLCGTLTGEHVYFDATDECHTLAFTLGSSAFGVTIPTRSFNVRVTQYACGYNNLAPAGCSQYFFGPAGTGYVKSFNYDAGSHLANQNQVICVRRETGMCKICWSADAVTDVIISGKNTKIVTKASSCCGYGADGMKSTGAFDCIQIPGAVKDAVGSTVVKNNEYCGGKGGLVTASGTTSKTICSKSYPFRLEFFSDGIELAESAAVEGPNKGFKLKYFETAC